MPVLRAASPSRSPVQPRFSHFLSGSCCRQRSGAAASASPRRAPSRLPETYGPKRRDFPLSNLNDTMRLLRVRCRYCKRQHNYTPSDLIQIFGDVDVDSLACRMKCENGSDHGLLDVEAFVPTGREAVGLRIRQLVRSKSIGCRCGKRMARNDDRPY
ncbi:hypothetical protein MPLB_2410004 [Mesorhizobium sp. ORS 3324]|nr:hypothetical protein MPLB_2410004 [Mesorhizobium sp. ORS 3324]